jgi:hypothetical protein
MILGAMDQKLWVFEVFGQDLAKAGMCNQQELTTCAKSGGQKKKKKKQFALVHVLTCRATTWGQQPLVANPRSPASCGSTPRQGQTIHFLK